MSLPGHRDASRVHLARRPRPCRGQEGSLAIGAAARTDWFVDPSSRATTLKRRLFSLRWQVITRCLVW